MLEKGIFFLVISTLFCVDPCKSTSWKSAAFLQDVYSAKSCALPVQTYLFCIASIHYYDFNGHWSSDFGEWHLFDSAAEAA
jgi:hypothetical protein